MNNFTLAMGYKLYHIEIDGDGTSEMYVGKCISASLWNYESLVEKFVAENGWTVTFDQETFYEPPAGCGDHYRLDDMWYDHVKPWLIAAYDFRLVENDKWDFLWRD